MANIIVADEKGRTDGSMYRLLEGVSSKLPIVLMSRTQGFRFNESLRQLGAYILCDVSEMGWNFEITESHLWGGNTNNFPQYENEEYQKFDDWVAGNQPAFILQRELLQKDVTDKRKPIDYPCWFTVPPPESKETFDKRMIEVFNYWGRSNERRLSIHGSIWIHAVKKGLNVCDTLGVLESFIMKEDGRKWVTLNLPHYSRVPMEELIQYLRFSKIVLSPRGAGYKCFRTTEASMTSVLCMHHDNLAYSYDWVHGKNCIKMPYGETETCEEEMAAIEAAIHREDLYDIYNAGVRNCLNYQVYFYIEHYLNPLLENYEH